MSSQADNGWIVTYTGRKFHPLAPHIEDLDIEDIAHGLSNICRFTGQCRQFYSVAQHSILAARFAPHWLKLSMLLHDASEAYLCDVSRPVKHAPGMEAYRAAEQRLQTLIGRRFGVSFDDPLLHEIDDRMLMTERRDLMDCQHTWFLNHARPFETHVITPWTPERAERAFLGMFNIYQVTGVIGGI